MGTEYADAVDAARQVRDDLRSAALVRHAAELASIEATFAAKVSVITAAFHDAADPDGEA